MSQAEDNFEREIIQRMVAQAAWDLLAAEPSLGWLTARVERGIMTIEQIGEYFSEELHKLL